MVKIIAPPIGSVDILARPNDSEVQVRYSIGDTLHFEVEDVPVSSLPLPYGAINLDIGWLPPMVRWISESGGIVVLERSPELREIQYSRLSRSDAMRRAVRSPGKNKSKYKILMPWQVFVLGIADNYTPYNIFAFTRPKPLESIDDDLYVMPMPNVYGDGRVCAPMLAEISEHDCTTIAQAINLAYSMFWSSGFNYDLTNAVRVAIRGEFIPHNVAQPEDHDEYDTFFRSWSQNVKTIKDINFCNSGDDRNANQPLGWTDEDPSGTTNDGINLLTALRHTGEMLRSSGNPQGMLVNGVINAATTHGTSSLST